MIIKCDKCGKEEEEALYIFDYHFCNKCKDDLNVITIHWVMEMCQFKSKRKGTQGAISIDWDKACALRLAGWSVEDIADEIGARKDSIRATLSNKLEMYKHGKRWGKPLKAQEDEDDEWKL